MCSLLDWFWYCNLPKDNPMDSLLEVLIEYTSNSQISYLLSRLIDTFKPISTLLRDLHHWIFWSTMNRNVDKVLYLVGISYLGFLSYRGAYHVKWLFEHAFGYTTFDRYNFRLRYGQNSYVVISGFTQGIGLAFACEFAKLKFNLVLVGRNQVKIQKALIQIKKSRKQIDVKIVQADFQDRDYNLKGKVQEATKGLDVSILVNNVGLALGGPFVDHKKQNITKVFKTNVNSMVTMNRIFVPRFKDRFKRSAIINLSSCTGVFPSPFKGAYSATKCYVDVVSRILQKECKGYNVDVLTYRPFGVSTPMMGNKRGPLMITPLECASTAIHQLGFTNQSFGGYVHKLSGQYFYSMSEEERFQTYSKYGQ